MNELNTFDWTAELSSVHDLADYFCISKASIPGLMMVMDVPRRGKGYPWIRVWIALGIDMETVRDPDVLKAPLLELKEVASILGESAKTTRRRSEGQHKDQSFPAHIDLGPRKRLFFDSEIHAWMMGVPKLFERRQINLAHISQTTQKVRLMTRPKEAPSPKQTPRSSVVKLFMAPPASS